MEAALGKNRPLAHLLAGMVVCTQLACGMAQPRELPPTPVKEAVDRCVAFFQANKDQVAPDAYLVYQYLMDRYDLPPIGSRDMFIRELQQDTALYRGYRPFFSFMEPIPFEPGFLVSGEGSDPLMAAGLWYDHLPDKGRLNELVRTMDLGEGYMVTHALLARSVARQQFGAPPDALLDTMLLRCAMDIIEAKRPFWGDLEIEALAFIQFSDPQLAIDPAYIDEVVALQNEDGSWSTQGEYRGIADHHTTVLALWALLQRNDTRRPGKARPLVLR